MDHPTATWQDSIHEKEAVNLRKRMLVLLKGVAVAMPATECIGIAYTTGPA